MQRILAFTNNADRHEIEDRFPSRPPDVPCYVCGRPVKPGRGAMVHVVGGGGAVMASDAEATLEEASGDLYWHPVGDSCLRRHPELRSYAVRAGR